MFFFALIAAVTLLAALAGRLGAPGLDRWPARMRLGLAVALALAGADHLANPWRYLPMLPEVVPFPRATVLLTGLCEIAGGVGLLVPRPRRLAGIMLALYFVCVFPANIRNALAGGAGVKGLPVAAASAWYYWLRLGFQPLVVWWALRAAEVIAWPQRPARRHAVGA
jgi:uncharacterized membrane protein